MICDACLEANSLFPLNRITDMCKNITLPQSSFAGDKNSPLGKPLEKRIFHESLLCIVTATLINKAGYRVQASIQSLRAAMDHFAGDMTERLTSVLVDAGDRKAYPIAGYTYFIVRMSEMTNCDSAVELVR